MLYFSFFLDSYLLEGDLNFLIVMSVNIIGEFLTPDSLQFSNNYYFIMDFVALLVIPDIVMLSISFPELRILLFFWEKPLASENSNKGASYSSESEEKDWWLIYSRAYFALKYIFVLSAMMLANFYSSSFTLETLELRLDLIILLIKYTSISNKNSKMRRNQLGLYFSSSDFMLASSS